MDELLEGIETDTEVSGAEAAGAEAAGVQAEQADPGAASDWRGALPEELRGNESLGKFKSAADLAKSYLSMEKLVGKKTVGMPDENSSEEEWGALFDRLGRPASADKYEVKRAEGLPPELIDEEGTRAFLAVAHKSGLSQKQVSALIGEYDRQLSEGVKMRRQQEEAQKGAVLSELRGLWGQDLQLRVERAEQTLGILDPDRTIDRDKLKNNVQVLQLLNRFSDKVLGDSLPKGPENGTVSDLEDRIAVLRANPAFSNEMHLDHDKIMTEYRMLMQKRTAMRGRTRL